MTWTIWINFLPPPSHPMAVPHEIWLQLAQWFQRRYLNTHTHTHTHTTILQTDRQTDRHTYIHTPGSLRHWINCTCILAHQNTTTDSCSWWKIWGGGVGGGLWRQSTIFLLGGGGEEWRGCCCCCCFNPVGGWLLWKCIIFCRWWSFSKMQFCGYPLFKWDLLEW